MHNLSITLTISVSLESVALSPDLQATQIVAVYNHRALCQHPFTSFDYVPADTYHVQLLVSSLTFYIPCEAPTTQSNFHLTTVCQEHPKISKL